MGGGYCAQTLVTFYTPERLSSDGRETEENAREKDGNGLSMGTLSSICLKV